MKQMKLLVLVCALTLAAGCAKSSPALSSATPGSATSTAKITAQVTASASPSAAQSASAAPAKSTAPAPSVGPTPTPQPLTAVDLQLVVDDKYYRLQSDVKTLTDLLGKYTKKSVAGKITKGSETQFIYSDSDNSSNITFTTFPSGSTDVVYIADFTGGMYATARYMGVGSSNTDVLTAYGPATYTENGLLVYTFDGKKATDKTSSITFKIESGLVTEITIYDAGNVH